MAHIGDSHPQAKATSVPLAIDRIVKIPSIFAIDGDKGLVTKIKAAFFIVLTGLIAEGACLLKNTLGPFPRNLMCADCDVDFQTGIEVITQDFLDLALRTQDRGWIIGNSYRHHLPWASVGLAVRWYQDVLCNSRVVGKQVADATLFHVPTGQYLGGPLKHLDDFPLGAPTMIDTRLRDEHGVPIKDQLHVSGVQKKIVPLREWGSKPVAIPMTDNPATCQL